MYTRFHSDLNSRLAADQNWALTSFHISSTKIIKGAYKNMEKVCTPKLAVNIKSANNRNCSNKPSFLNKNY